jgi:hypothetical protein
VQSSITAGESESTAASNRSIALLTTVDQMLSSASNALLLFVLAQIATVAEFGVIALLIAIFTTWIGFNRGSVGTPILLVSNLRKREILIESGYAMSWTAVNSLGAVALACVIGAVSGQHSLALAFAIALPAVLVQDVLRYPPIACGKPMIAVLSDSFWALFMLTLFIANLAGATISLEVAILLWGLTGLVSASVLAVASSVKPNFHRLWAWWRTYSQTRIRFGGTYATVALSSTATILVVTTIAGVEVAGGLRGASTLLGPISMLIMAVPMVFVPHVRRASTAPRAQWRLLAQTSIATSVLTVVCTVLLLLIPVELGTLVLGKIWAPAISVVPYIGIDSVAICWMVSIYSWLQTQGMGRTLFRLRLLHVGLQLSCCTIAAIIFSSAIAIAVSLASSSWFMVLIGLAVVRRGVNNSTRSADQALLTADDTTHRKHI